MLVSTRQGEFHMVFVQLVNGSLSYCKLEFLLKCCKNIQEGQKCPKRRVAQAAIRLATAVNKFTNKERNVGSPS